jgi:hypothetical protein
MLTFSLRAASLAGNAPAGGLFPGTIMEANTAQPANKKSVLPSLGDMIFLIVFLFPLTLLPNYMFGDGSVGWHLAIGDYCLQHLAAPMKDFISYTHPGKPWVAFYWLFDVGMSAFNMLGGINGVAVYCAAIIATVFLLIYKRMREEGCDQYLTAIFVMIAAVASTIHWIARPLLASFAGVYLFSTALEDFHRRKISQRRMLIMLGLGSLIWMNAHPACIMGFASLIIYMATAAGTAIATADADIRKNSLFEVKWLAIALAVCFGATLINPWGFDLWVNDIANLSPGKLIDSVDEYKSPIFHGALYASALELIYFILAFGLFLRRKDLSMPQLLNTLAFAHLSLQNMRNIPVFVITALPFIGFLYGQVPEMFLAGRTDSGWVTRFLQKWSRGKSELDGIERKCSLHLLPIATVVVFVVAAANGGKLFGTELLACDFDPSKLPTTTLAYIKDHHLPAEHGFNHVNWGGLINYRTKLPIFIDDRASFFGEDFYYRYGLAVSLAPGWQEYLDEHHIDWIIYPKDSAFVHALTESGRWKMVAEDKVACILQRQP